MKYLITAIVLCTGMAALSGCVVEDPYYTEGNGTTYQSTTTYYTDSGYGVPHKHKTVIVRNYPAQPSYFAPTGASAPMPPQANEQFEAAPAMSGASTTASAPAPAPRQPRHFAKPPAASGASTTGASAPMPPAPSASGFEAPPSASGFSSN